MDFIAGLEQFLVAIGRTGINMRKFILILIFLLIPGLSFAGSQQIRNVVTMAKVQSGGYLFSWDAETDTANLSSGTVQATVNGDPTLSTDYAVSPTKSLKATGGLDFYRFTTNAYTPAGGVIRLRMYGNYTSVGSAARSLTIYGDTSNFIDVYHAATDRVAFYHKLTGANVYCLSNNSTMGAGWNDVIFTYAQNGGSTDWSISINGSAAGSGSSANVWNAAVTPIRIDVGTSNSTAPIGPVYVDDVVIQ